MLSKFLSVRLLRLPRRKMTSTHDLTMKFQKLSLKNTHHNGNETQQHGFVWEKEIGRVLGASIEEINSISYTSNVDLPSCFNRKNQVDNHCKTTGSQTVCMGSSLRIFDILISDKTHLTVIHYTQNDHWKVVKNIYQLDLAGMRTEFFGDITHEEISNLESIIKSIPPGRLSRSERERIYNKMKKELESKSGLMKLNPKVDSKSQRRLQCSFNIKSFIEKYPSRCIYSGVGNKFYDGYIPPKIESRRRRLKRRKDIQS